MLQFSRVLLLLWELIDNPASGSEVSPQVVVDFAETSPGSLKHFWRSTGLCPPEPHQEAEKFLLSQDEKLNLALIGALPQGSIEQVRIHWLLNLVKVRQDEDGNPAFNYTYLDELVDWLWVHNLQPGFEIMGNPSEYFDDFENESQVLQWKQLVRSIANRYIGAYGLEYVSRWRFESWNEPDLKGYNVMNFTLAGFINYYESTSEGLALAHQSLKFGGPAGLFKKRTRHPLCWGLLNHCARNSTRLDFISFHKKGDGFASSIVQKDVALIEQLRRDFPELRAIPVGNDEADPLTGWSKNASWRADVTYAAMVVQVIEQHQRTLVEGKGETLEVLSNDNGFLNYHPFYFTQRTLLTRFQMNNTDPPHLQFFKKPVYVAMAMLSLLGDEQLNVTLDKKDYRLSLLAASRNYSSLEPSAWSAGVLLAFCDNTTVDIHTVINVTVTVTNIPIHDSARYVVYQMNNARTSPSAVWEDAGAPVFPGAKLRYRMRQAEGPYRIGNVQEVPELGEINPSVLMQLPSVVLVHVCSRTQTAPGRVSRLEAFNVTFNEVLLIWSEENVATSCIKTYEVEFSPVFNINFRRINAGDTIFLSYQHVVFSSRQGPEKVRGLYRVRAVDYWDQPGPHSSVLQYGVVSNEVH